MDAKSRPGLVSDVYAHVPVPASGGRCPSPMSVGVTLILLLTVSCVQYVYFAGVLDRVQRARLEIDNIRSDVTEKLEALSRKVEALEQHQGTHRLGRSTDVDSVDGHNEWASQEGRHHRLARSGGYGTPIAIETPAQASQQDSNAIRGPKGDKGDKGDKGSRGPRGYQGPKGDQGKALHGERGVKGNRGPEGRPGMMGTKGEPGDRVAWAVLGNKKSQNPSFSTERTWMFKQFQPQYSRSADVKSEIFEGDNHAMHIKRRGYYKLEVKVTFMYKGRNNRACRTMNNLMTCQFPVRVTVMADNNIAENLTDRSCRSGSSFAVLNGTFVLPRIHGNHSTHSCLVMTHTAVLVGHVELQAMSRLFLCLGIPDEVRQAGKEMISLDTLERGRQEFSSQYLRHWEECKEHEHEPECP